MVLHRMLNLGLLLSIIIVYGALSCVPALAFFFILTIVVVVALS